MIEVRIVLWLDCERTTLIVWTVKSVSQPSLISQLTA